MRTATIETRDGLRATLDDAGWHAENPVLQETLEACCGLDTVGWHRQNGEHVSDKLQLLAEAAVDLVGGSVLSVSPMPPDPMRIE